MKKWAIYVVDADTDIIYQMWPGTYDSEEEAIVIVNKLGSRVSPPVYSGKTNTKLLVLPHETDQHFGFDTE